MLFICNKQHGVQRFIFGFLLLMVFGSQQMHAQSIKITAVVYDADNRILLSNLMVINRTTQQGFFAGANGQFTISCNKNDTILIACTGYQTLKLCYRDSTVKADYFARLYMNKLMVKLKEVEIIAKRDLEVIERDIQKLGYDKSDYMLSGVDAFNSPITFLYQAFSKRERAKRDIAEKRNEDRKRELLKELLVKYVDYDVINLDTEEFDDFITYCNVPEEFMKQSTQYEFIIYIKRKFEFYRALKNKY